MATRRTDALQATTVAVLEAAIERSQRTKSEFAHRAGMDSSALQKYLRGEHHIGFEKLAYVLRSNGLRLTVGLKNEP